MKDKTDERMEIFGLLLLNFLDTMNENKMIGDSVDIVVNDDVGSSMKRAGGSKKGWRMSVRWVVNYFFMTSVQCIVASINIYCVVHSNILRILQNWVKRNLQRKEAIVRYTCKSTTFELNKFYIYVRIS